MALQRLRRMVGGLVRRVRPPGAQHNGEEGAGFYDTLFKGADAYQKPYQQSHYYFLWSVIVDRVRRAKLRRVLEIGCGPGQLAAYLFDQGIEEYVGLDFSSRAVEMARHNAPRGRYHVGDARRPEIYGAIDYDVLICTEALEHIEDDFAVLANFRPGKRCLCSVPNFDCEGHVRFFRDAAAVTERFGRFFDDFDVMTFRSPCDPADLFYLFDGIRKG